MKRFTAFALLMLFTFVATLTEAKQLYTVAKHNEKLKQRLGYVQILTATAYPVTIEQITFYNHLGLTKELGSRYIMRDVTAEEGNLIRKGIYPYQHIAENAPAYIATNSWRKKYADAIRSPKKIEVGGAELLEKYTVPPEDYPMIMYFAPSGNLYKIPTPAWRSAPSYRAFWEILQEETNLKGSDITRFWTARANDQIEFEKDIPRSIKNIDLNDLTWGYEEKNAPKKEQKPTQFYTIDN